jgi:hypothetical protein
MNTTTTDNRSASITALAGAAQIEEAAAWETVKDICGAYGRWTPNINHSIRVLAKEMWINPDFKFNAASLSLLAAAVRFANGLEIEQTFVLEKVEWDRDGLGLECDHPLCDRLHRKGCPVPGGRIWISWVYLDAVTGERNVPWEISDNYDRKRDAVEAFNRYVRA